MWRSTLHYGRKGLALFAISAVDLALWDLCGKLRDEPVYMLLGGETKPSLPATAPGSSLAATRTSASSAPSCPCPMAPPTVRPASTPTSRWSPPPGRRSGPNFDLMLDCYMALTVPYTIALAEALRPVPGGWIEEPLPPDDYDGHARIKAACPWQRFSTGEHE